MNLDDDKEKVGKAVFRRETFIFAFGSCESLKFLERLIRNGLFNRHLNSFTDSVKSLLSIFKTYVHDIPGPGLFDLFISKAHEILSSLL